VGRVVHEKVGAAMERPCPLHPWPLNIHIDNEIQIVVQHLRVRHNNHDTNSCSSNIKYTLALKELHESNVQQFATTSVASKVF